MGNLSDLATCHQTLALQANPNVRWTPGRKAKFNRAVVTLHIRLHIKEHIMEAVKHVIWLLVAIGLVSLILAIGSWWDELEGFWKTWDDRGEEESEEHA